MSGAVALIVVVAGATAFGLLWRSRSGRMHVVGAGDDGAIGRTGEVGEVGPGGVTAALAALGVVPGAAPVTLVQFSSAFCAPCRATRLVCASVAERFAGVRHVEVDAEAHLDAVRRLHIWRTPTVLVVDGAGTIVHRATGTLSAAQVTAAVAPLLAAGAAR